MAAVKKQSYEKKEIPTKCPYCGGRMVIKYIGDLDPESYRANKLICVCEHYDDTCTCSVKVEKSWDGKMYPLGVPADSNLKSMRCEAHHYFAYLEKLDIMNDSYLWLSTKLGISRDECHYSMFREARCQMAIKATLEVLGNHKDKTQGKVFPYRATLEGIKPYTESDQEAKELLLTLL
jgi:hypothetical protein